MDDRGFFFIEYTDFLPVWTIVNRLRPQRSVGMIHHTIGSLQCESEIFLIQQVVAILKDA